MEEERFHRIRQEHEDLKGALERLALVFNVPTRPRRTLVAALDAFLDGFEARVGRHLDVEERELYPQLGRHLPAETGSIDTVLRDHDTIRGLVALLHLERERLKEGVPDAEAEVATAIRDLTLLFRQHTHKVDGVIQPLLRSLRKAADA